jgi:RNA polymerase sigma-70 factor (ECF subfamily)
MTGTSQHDEDDQSLVNTYLRERDEQSFRELYRRHTSALYASALRLCGSDADAQDVIQETWIRACRAVSSFKWKSSFRTWLIGVLVNCVREQSRNKNSKKTEPLSDDFAELSTNESGERLNLEQAIAQLPTGYRHVLTLHDVEGYTHEEIGEFLSITAGTSKSQLHRARKAIRAALAKE